MEATTNNAFSQLGYLDFQDLVLAYFEAKRDSESGYVHKVDTQAAAFGQDGGKDIVIWCEAIRHPILGKVRSKWIVQVKHNVKTILSPSDLNDMNLPSFLHSQQADGYLLVCSGLVSTKLEKMFTDLSSQNHIGCRLLFKYEIFDGNQFKRRLSKYPELLNV